MIELRTRILALYDTLAAHFEHEPHWWPIISDQPHFEIIVGMVLVQQTRWQMVEAAIQRLINAGLFTPATIAAADPATLAALIRPCAFYSQKAPGLQAICRYILDKYDGDIGAMLAQPRAPLRAELLALPRVGRETADTIMLYAGGHPVFIVDAYARRLLSRVNVEPGFDFMRAPYDAVQALVESAFADWPEAEQLARSTQAGSWGEERMEKGTAISVGITLSPLASFMWDFHALIVEACIHHCLAKRPRQETPGLRPKFVDPRKCASHCVHCSGCPARFICATYQAGVVPA